MGGLELVVVDDPPALAGLDPEGVGVGVAGLGGHERTVAGRCTVGGVAKSEYMRLDVVWG
jgi:hypothetical protein